MDKEYGTLKTTEPHPMALDALEYVRSQGTEKLWALNESFASCAIEGNRLAEICGGTLSRLFSKEPVSDRYILGLAWYIKKMEAADER